MKNTFSILTIAILFLSLSIEVLAQQTEDVIYLSSGSIIRGVLLKDSSTRTIHILNHAGDTWTFYRKDIDSVKREKPFEYKAIMFNQRGFEFNMNAEFLMRSGGNAIGNAVNPGINIAFGYKFTQYVSVGAETGVEFYNWMEIPVQASLRLRTSFRAVSPLLLFRLGYTFPAEKRADDYEYSYKSLGGISTTIGAGFERIISENSSFLLTFSYHYQELNYHLSPLYQNQWLEDRDRTETYSRFRLTLGYVFK